ncbi:MAG TPA: hypothetical protein DGP39_04100 [Verrucomicrobiales bacterium]|nr:hypothetical protein [Verrucomicrobiales bacterium]
MKTALTILSAALLGSALGYILKPNASAPKPDAAAAPNSQERAEQLRQRADSKQVEFIEIPSQPAAQPTAAVAPRPEAIIAQLTELKVDDARAPRRAVYHLERLVDLGDAALPAISAFMEKDQDMAFSAQSIAPTNPQPAKGGGKGKRSGSEPWNYFRPYPRLQMTLPETLRLGLLEVTTHIGTSAAEALLLEVLENTGRGVEVAYLELALQKISPDQHVEKILAVTRELLAIAPDANTEASLAVDRRARGYLYAILVKYKDRVFVPTAQKLLVRADGTLDGHVLGYLRRVLGADAIPILQTAINDNRITDDVAHYAVRDAVLHYIGESPAADALLLQTVRDGLARQEENGRLNWGVMKLPLQALYRNLGEQSADSLRARQRLVQQIRDEHDNQSLSDGLVKLDVQLEAALAERTGEGAPDK